MKVMIEIEDAEGGFHLSVQTDPPLSADGMVRPTPALLAGAVAKRAIEEMVRMQERPPSQEGTQQEVTSQEVTPDATN